MWEQQNIDSLLKSLLVMSPCFVAPTSGVKYTSTVYLTWDVGATKHRLIAKIPDKCAGPLSTNYVPR